MHATDRYRALVQGPEMDLAARLDEAALLVAAHAHPDLDVDAYLGRLDAIALACPSPTTAGVVSHLFATLGFVGATDDYHDPRNSYLDEVIDRRRGIPISLSVLTIGVGRRVGVTFEPVGMPGHFLVRAPMAAGTLFDPFDGGRRLTEAACRRRFHDLLGAVSGWDPSYLDPVEPRAVVARLLANLRSTALARGDLALLDWVVRLRAAIPGVQEEAPADLRRQALARRAPLN
jgi:regulator of sirC expression with transglutaminase-like and TPR domain